MGHTWDLEPTPQARNGWYRGAALAPARPPVAPRAGAVSQNSLPSSPSACVLLLLAQSGRAEGERVDVNRCGGSWA